MSKWRRGRFGWTKDAWLAYREWADGYEKLRAEIYKIRRVVPAPCAIVAEMCERED